LLVSLSSALECFKCSQEANPHCEVNSHNGELLSVCLPSTLEPLKLNERWGPSREKGSYDCSRSAAKNADELSAVGLIPEFLLEHLARKFLFPICASYTVDCDCL